MDAPIRFYIKEYYAFWLGVSRLYEEWAKAHSMSSFALFTLYALWEGGTDCTQKKICEEWLMPKQTVNTILKGFGREGYVVFQELEADRRNKLVRLTEKGRAYADGILKDLNQLEETVMEQMGAEGRADMARSNAQFMTLFKKELQRRKLC